MRTKSTIRRFSRTAKSICILSACAVLFASAAYCEDAPASREIKTAEGSISDIDWAGSKLSIRWLNQDDNVFHDTVLSVPDEAKIRKGTEEINFSELEISDEVTAKYYEDFDGTATLISLSVTDPD